MKDFKRLLFGYTCVDIELFFENKKLNNPCEFAVNFHVGASFAQLQLIRDLDLLDEFTKYAAKRDITEDQIHEILD